MWRPPARRGPLLAGLVASCVLLLVGAVSLLARPGARPRDTPSLRAVVPQPTGSTATFPVVAVPLPTSPGLPVPSLPVPGLPVPTRIPQEPGPGLGSAAVVDVAVAGLWARPGMARPLDRPSLGNPVDMPGWLAGMGKAERLWLVDRLVTQALYGDRVVVLETEGDWTKVAVPRQPSSQDPRGYPGWLPTVQLSRLPMPDTGRHAVVVSTRSMLRDAGQPGRALLEVSFNTRLPVLSVEPPWVTVATPSGGRGLLASSDVEVHGADRRPASGAELVRAARLFSGLPYLWAGTSASGFDCSGLTSAVYGAHGLVIPRDADDQAAVGVPVERGDLQPGDLLFFAGRGGEGKVHHVGMYMGDGLMIQSPATGRVVETVPIDRPGLASTYWGARRYLGALVPR